MPEPGSGAETFFRQLGWAGGGGLWPSHMVLSARSRLQCGVGGWLGVPGLSRSDEWWGTRGRVPGPNPEHRAGEQGWISAGHLASWKSLASPSQVPHEGSPRRAQ